MPQMASDSQSPPGSVNGGSNPGSKAVVVSESPDLGTPKELRLLSETKEQLETEIFVLSQQSGLDVDLWISQAQQLQADIEQSRAAAREIVAYNEQSKLLQVKIEDATSRVNLVKSEISCNRALTATLEQARDFWRRFEGIRTTIEAGQIVSAIQSLEHTESALQTVAFPRTSKLTSIISENITALRRSVTEAVLTYWNSHMKIDQDNGVLGISCQEGDLSLEQIISFMSHFDMLDSVVDALQRDVLAFITTFILHPCQSYRVSVENTGVSVGKLSSSASIPEIFDQVITVLSYLRQHLPISISDPLSGIVVPIISSKLIKLWLAPSIPIDLQNVDGFERILDNALEFCRAIEGYGWQGQEELISWVNQVSRIWLSKRRINSLDQVRNVLVRSSGMTKKAERVETEMISSKDKVFLGSEPTDDWNSSWAHDSEERSDDRSEMKGIDHDEDVSAWGLDDDAEEAKLDLGKNSPSVSNQAEDDDTEDAWGWGDDDSLEPVPIITQAREDSEQKKGSSAQREITLTESYTITDIPDSILAIIVAQITDSEIISGSDFAKSRVTSTGSGLLTLPTLVIAMFKATSPSFYSLKMNAGLMYLYNDSLYLAEQLHEVVSQHRLKRLIPDIEALEKFGKLSYSKEMQTQRIVITDLLDGSQGFAHCSEQPYLDACENAVNATVDRIRWVYKEWQSILSRSALLQAIGSLTSTVINKVVIDIEDLGDISESESQRLVSFSNRLSSLEDLFMPESAPDPTTESVSMAAVYVRSWLKFQYLINILDSSLADIKFLWLEGELRLEFTVGEVIDLVKALFAESEHRRRAIAEIRRAAEEQ